jgi:putative ABC transport system permease protein
MSLLLSLVRKDFKRNKIVTIALALFLFLSALLMAGGLRITGTMLSSLNGLNELAMPPDYLQMHKGEFDEEAFNQFVRNHEYVEKAQIVKMLNISNANIVVHGDTLEKYLMDNGFVIQNEKFDFLLNMNNEIARVEDGEIGVPVYYAEELGIRVGDTITLRNGNYSKTLKVTTLIRDASMNAALTSSKRFLISPADLNELSQNLGEWEYCFEFRLVDGTSTSTIEKDYMEAGMPSNGVAVTGSLLTLLNSLSYGLVAFIIIAISLLLIMLAFLCLFYIIRATMAEENSSIGGMKAIGLKGKAIVKLYLIKYIMLMEIASIIGYLIAIPFGDYFSKSVILYCGLGSQDWMKWMFPLLGIILLGFLVVFGCRIIIRKNLKKSVVELFRGEGHIKKEGHYSLKHLKYRNLPIALGELKCKWKEYLVIFFVFICSSFLMLIPMNMRNTIENPSFMTYMGVGKSDIRIDMPYSEELLEQKNALISSIEHDQDIEKYTIFQYGYIQLKNDKGDGEYIRVESGDETVFPLQYLEGKAPVQKNEMALSYLNAIELGKEVGDSLGIIYQGEERLFTISGIYQDITYGGKTAKANINFNEKDVDVYIIYLDLRDHASIENKIDELRIITNSKVTPVSEFVSQTLGGVSSNIRLVEGAATVLSILLIMLITLMVLQLIIAREHREIAIKKAIGFRNKDIRIQLALRILLTLCIAVMVGTLLANVLGEVFFSLILSSMGASKITMLVAPVKSYVIVPILQLLSVLIILVIGTKVVRHDHIKDQIKE